MMSKSKISNSVLVTRHSLLRLSIADITISLLSNDPELKLGLNGTMKKFLIDEARPDVTMEARWSDLSKEIEGTKVFDSGTLWKLYSYNGRYVFSLTSPLLGSTPYKVAEVSSDFSRGEVLLHRPFFDTAQPIYPLEYPLDELLFINFLSLGGGVEIHACGVIDSLGRGHLFAGQSGAGKTTMAKLWQDEAGITVLSDDRIVLRKMQKQTITHNEKSKRLIIPCHLETLKQVQGDITDYGQIWMYGTPWHGDAGLASPARAPLRRVYFLTHGKKNELIPLRTTESLARLFACSFPPFYNPEALDFTLSFLEGVIKAMPCCELKFVPDERVVKFIQ